MQISRLFEIVYLLLDRRIITDKELAEHFEVSVRTIYREYRSPIGGGDSCVCQSRQGRRD